MTQLSYQPAFDPYHTMFRVLRFRNVADCSQAYPLDSIRIMDYFLAFPFRMGIISFQAAHRSFRKISKLYSEHQPYGDSPSDWTLFGRMEAIQRASMSTLAHEGFIDAGDLVEGFVRFTNLELTPALQQRVSDLNDENVELMNALKVLLYEYDLVGPNGLKKRSGLLEHRYDAA